MDLSLKYRPKKFSEVNGQHYIVQSIQNAIKYQEVAPLYLFSGAHGTGKTTIARLIAMAVCCPEINDGEPCGKCKNCKAILNGNNFADVYEINAAQFTKKDDADSMIFDTVNYQPMIADKKIYILDECHQLSRAAQQSLLKIFEEPPDNVIFILCTTEINKVLATIVDRSLHYEFKPIPTKNIFERVKFICQSEKVDISEDALWLIAKEANGSMRKPFKILNTVGLHDPISVEALENIIGTTNLQTAITLLEYMINSDRFASVKLIDDIILDGKNIENVLLDVMECLLDILKIKMYKENCIINKPDHSIVKLKELSVKIKKGDTIINVLNILDGGIKRLNNSYAAMNVVATTIVLETIKNFG